MMEFDRKCASWSVKTTRANSKKFAGFRQKATEVSKFTTDKLSLAYLSDKFPFSREILMYEKLFRLPKKKTKKTFELGKSNDRLLELFCMIGKIIKLSPAKPYLQTKKDISNPLIFKTVHLKTLVRVEPSQDPIATQFLRLYNLL